MPMAKLRATAIIALCAVVFLIASEIYFRRAGYASYPIYDVDDEIKYIPAVNQHGSVRNRNAWFFNDRHMGNASDWRPQIHPNLLLIGDSIVLGGNSFDHEDKLGPLLEKDLGGRYAVWSAAAGGWTNVNQMTYLDRNPDVLGNADAVIFEFFEGGFSGPATWPGYYIYPDHRPLILTEYLVHRSVLWRLANAGAVDFNASPTGPPDAVQLRRFKALAAGVAKDRKTVIFMYPTLENLRNAAAWRNEIAPLEEICRTAPAKCVDLAQEPAWSEKAYADDGVHPTVQGNKILAGILAKAMN